MALNQTHQPITSVLGQIISDTAELLQTEIQLARAEISEKLAKAASGGTMIGAGAVLLLSGIFVLFLGIVKWLAIAGLPEQWGLLLVGGVALVIGLGLAMKGAGDMKASASMPKKTVEQIRADYSVLKERVG